MSSCFNPQRLAHRHAQLHLHQIEPGHHLGHRMLHLQPRIHLEEVEVLRGIDQKLDRPRVDISGRQRQPHRRLAHPAAAGLRSTTADGASSITF